MWNIDSPEVSRSLGWINIEEQEAKFAGGVCLAGVGGAGFLTGLSLVRDGVHNINVADMDGIDDNNFNRIVGANVNTVGQNKAELFADMAREINPDVTVRVFTDGVTEDNVDEFIHGMDVGFDGIDLNHPEATVLYARKLRAKGLPMVSGMEIGPSAMITSFHPNPKVGKTFERMAGFKDDEPLDEIADKAKENLDLTRLVPYLPFTAGDTSVLKAVLNGASLPSNAEGVNLYASLANHELGLHLTRDVQNNREKPVWAPNYYVVDNSRRYAGVVRASRGRFIGQVLHARVREMLNMNPRASYDYVLAQSEAQSEAQSTPVETQNLRAV